MEGWMEDNSTKRAHLSPHLISSLLRKGGGKKITFWGVFSQELFLSFCAAIYLDRENVFKCRLHEQSPTSRRRRRCGRKRPPRTNQSRGHCHQTPKEASQSPLPLSADLLSWSLIHSSLQLLKELSPFRSVHPSTHLSTHPW